MKRIGLKIFILCLVTLAGNSYGRESNTVDLENLRDFPLPELNVCALECDSDYNSCDGLCHRKFRRDVRNGVSSPMEKFRACRNECDEDFTACLLDCRNGE